MVSSFFAYFFIPGELLEFSQSLLSSLFFSSNFFFWQNTGYFFSENELKPLIHTWSLAVEEQFYIFFPLLILISLKFLKKMTVPLITLCFFISLTLAEIESSDGSAGSFYLLPTRAWELISGILCAFYLRNKKVDISSKLKDFISTFGLILILSSLLIFREKFVHPGLITLMPVIGTVIIIIFYNKESFIYRLLSHKFFAFNGLISYSLYMWHQPVITFLSYNDKLNDNSEKFLAFLLIFFLSIFSWKVIETPFRNTKIIPNRRFYTILLTVFSSLCLVSIYGISSQGLLKNYPKNVHNLLLNDNQYGKYVWEKSQSYEEKILIMMKRKHTYYWG